MGWTDIQSDSSGIGPGCPELDSGILEGEYRIFVLWENSSDGGVPGKKTVVAPWTVKNL
ncbi:hypothetical protein [Pasteuria penetrans]|uniref:hypothetical protein n=1 Tax=Pasteuria penetrans TaxID=86005 RepID=UPI000F9966E8|nr:hypothetical protein [Pasteuria penetrans]